MLKKCFKVFRKIRIGKLDNVILMPHIGSYVKEARVAMEEESTINLLKGLGIDK